MCRLSGLISARSGDASKKYDGIADDELIERRAAGHEHRGRAPAAAAGAPGSLPGRRDRARVTGHHADVERTDVDAELERVRRDDGAHAALAQPLFDLAAALRQIAAAVAANLLRRARRRLEIVLEIRRQDLGRQPALREHDRLQLALQELGGDPPRLAKVRPPDAELRVHDRRVHEEEELLATRRAALGSRARTAARSALRPARADWRSSPTST